VSPSPDKVRAYRLGHVAETMAALLLRCKGYRILERRYRTKVGEIDLIARRGRVLAMVEVKARSPSGGIHAAESLSAKQRRRIERAANTYLANHAASQNCDIRFDLIVVGRGRLPRHLAGAWIAGD